MRPSPFRKYQGFARGQFLNTLAFKFNIYSWIIQDILSLTVLVFLWLAIYQSAGGMDAEVNGFTFSSMIAYLVTTAISAEWTTANGTSFFTVTDDIAQGNISIALTKPVDYRLKNLFSSLGSMVASFLLFFLPLYLIAILTMHFAIGIPWPLWYNVIFYLLSGVFAFLIMDSLDFLFAQTAMLTNSMFGVMIIKGSIISILSGSAIPFSFYPAWAQAFLSYLPFAGLSSTPVNILLGRFSVMNSVYALLLQLAWVIALYLLSYYSNHRLLRHVEAAGG